MDGKMKHKCPAIDVAWSLKVTAPGITPGMNDRQIISMAHDRTRFFASSPCIAKMPSKTQGDPRSKVGRKG